MPGYTRRELKIESNTYGVASIDPAIWLALGELDDEPELILLAGKLLEYRRREIDRGYIAHACGPCMFIVSSGDQCERCGRRCWTSKKL